MTRLKPFAVRDRRQARRTCIALLAVFGLWAGGAKAAEPTGAPAVAPAVAMAGFEAGAACAMSEAFVDQRCWPLALLEIDETPPSPVAQTPAASRPDIVIRPQPRLTLQQRVRGILAPLGDAASMALACAIQYQAVSQQHYLLRLDQADALTLVQNQALASYDLRQVTDADRFARFGMRFTIRY